MTWKVLYYGNETPSKIRRISVNSLYIVFGLSFYGWWNDFIPSELWTRASLFIITSISLVLYLILFREYKRNKSAMKINASSSKQFFFLSLVLPVCIFGFLWVALVHGLPGIFTQVFGERGEITTIMKKENGYSSKACEYRLRGDALDGALPNYICTSESQYYNFPDQKFSVLINGKKTIFGFYVIDVYKKNDG